MARVLITGGAGFIGSHLVDRLLGRGDDIIVVDDFNDYYDPVLKRANVAAHIRSPRYTLVQGDIRNGEMIDATIAGRRPDIIVHLAARVGIRPSVADPQLYATTNIVGTTHLLEAARKYGVSRFVFGSSSSVYGVNEKLPFSEDDPLHNIVSPYAATKLAGESLCNAYAHMHGLSAISLRLFTVYGPRQRPDLAVCKFTELMKAGHPLPLFGDGSSLRDYTYVGDIVRGIVAAMEVDSAGHQVVNLGNAEPVSLLEMVRTLESALGTSATIEWHPDQPGDVPRTWADPEKASRLLGYSPTTSLADGIGHMVEWMNHRTARSA